MDLLQALRRPSSCLVTRAYRLALVIKQIFHLNFLFIQFKQLFAVCTVLFSFSCSIYFYNYLFCKTFFLYFIRLIALLINLILVRQQQNKIIIFNFNNTFGQSFAPRSRSAPLFDNGL